MEQEFNNDNARLEHGHIDHDHRSDKHSRGNSGVTLWLVIGVVILIILLILWLTIADLWGDTDVAAQLVTMTGRSVTELPLSLL